MTQQSNSLVIPKKAWLGLWLIIFALLFAWRAQNLAAFGLSNDEGAHLMWAQLAVDGYPLYSEAHAVQAPLFIESIGLAFRLTDNTIQAGRWVTLIGFALLAVILSWLAYRADGWTATLTALLWLGISPLVFTYSRLVMAEIPATALATASVAFLFLYLERDRKGWLVISGLMLGLSFITKALYPFVVIVVGLLLWYHHTPGQGPGLTGRWGSLRKDWRGLTVDFLFWGISVALPLIAVILIYEPSALYDQLVAFRGDLRVAIPGSWAESWGHFYEFFASHWGIWLLAGGGIVSTFGRIYVQGSHERNELPTVPISKCSGGSADRICSPLLYRFIWLAWLVAGAALLLWHTPLFPHQFIILLPPLVLLAAGLVADVTLLWPLRRNYGLVSYGALIMLLFLPIGAVFNLPAMITANQKTAAIVTGGREQEALQLLAAVSNPDDFLMGDSQLMIFMAHRRTPPALGDVALVAIKAGRQSSVKMIDLTQEYQSPAVVQWSLRLPWLPEYLTWVETNYLTRRVWDNDHIIYFGQRLPAGKAIPNERQVRLGDWLTVRGYQLDPPAAGHELALKVYWQTSSALTDDYTIFTQLLDESGMFVVGRDSQPLGGFFPTSQWPKHEIVTDRVRFSLPADLPAGEYRLITGMYRLETLERLPVLDGAGDHIVLATINIE